MSKENRRPAPGLAPAGVCLFAALALFLLPQAARAQAQADEWVKLLAGPTYEMLEDGESVALHVPVALADGVQPGEVKLRLLYVRLGQRHNKSLLGAFSVSAGLGDDKDNGPAVNVVAYMPHASWQGTYELLVEATHTKEGTGNKPRLLTIQIFHPAAKLATLGTIVVEREVGLFAAPSVEGATLELRESAGQSRLVVNSIDPLKFFNERNDEAKGSVEFGGLPLAVPPWGGRAARYDLKGDFDTGTTKGSAVISSPQLAEPARVDFEIRTRVARWYIFAVIVLGLAAGYFLRTWLKRQVALNESRLKVYDLMEQLRLAIDKNADADFRGSVGPHIAALDAAAAGRDQDVMKAAVEAANLALQAAVALLEQNRAAARTKFEEAATLLKNFGTWSLPDDFKAALPPAVEARDAAAAALRVNNVGEADRQLTALVEGLAQRLRQLILTWKNETAARLEIIGGGQVALPARAAENLKQGVEQLLTLSQKVTPLPPAPGVADLSNDLQAVSDLRENISLLVGRLDAWLASEFGELKQALDRIAGTGPPAAQALGAAVEAYRGEIADASQHPEALLLLLTPARLAEFDEAWQAALRNQLTAADLQKPSGAEFEKLVEERKYVEAARAAQRIIHTRTSTA
ncbi:MAG TPA: hypothetical protein VF521_05445, partial [Pyrinomonadaceae bacterium]